MRKEFRTLISLNEAKSTVFNHLPHIDLETLPLEDALGRILGENIVSPINVPGFDRSAMDGYAVRSADTLRAREDQPTSLNLSGRVPMGTAPHIEVGPKQAIEVSTGSMMPKGADSVVMVEHAEEKKDMLLIRRPVHVGENVHRFDSDIALGETVLNPDTMLTAREIGVLAAVGRLDVKVKTLKVGVASTGNELIIPGNPIEPGQIYDINSYSIAAAVKDCGGSPVILGILPDDRQKMSEGLTKMIEQCSLVLVSGSTSAGKSDMFYRVLEDLGEIVFHGINLKPGKPTLFGLVDGKPIFGLPGYPTSALTVFGQLVAPMIRDVLGTNQRSVVVSGKLIRPIRSEGRRQMLSVGIVGGRIYPVDKGSGSITSLSMADGVIEIPDDVEYLDEGDKVEVHLFGDYSEPALLIMGEDCPAMDKLRYLLPFPVRLIAAGSRQGSFSVEEGIADLALISRFNNSSSIDDKRLVVKGYSRELVIMSKDAQLLEMDMLSGSRMIGWSRYSEMSKILDQFLDKNDLTVKLMGQARTHFAVAAAVKAGQADVGFGVRSAAEKEGLNFKKIAEDEIDVLINSERQGEGPVQIFLETLKSDKFKSMLSAGIELCYDTEIYSRKPIR